MSNVRGAPILVAIGMAVTIGLLGSGVSAASPTPVPAGNVSELVTFVPPSATSVGFTDWGRIRASQGAEDVTGASPMEDKLPVARSTGKDETVASGFGMSHLRDQAATWGWDSFDLDWEATVTADGPPLWVLRFRDGFDLAPVAARFDERGFSTTVIDGGTIRSHPLDLAADWLRATELAIVNTAFLDDGRTLVISSDADQVQDVVAHHGTYPDDPALDATAAALGGASAALFLMGLGTCQAFTPIPIDIADPFASPLPSLTVTGLHLYAVMGIGYGRPGWDPVGRIVFAYPDAATAQADLAGRAGLAETGVSQRTGQSYTDALFGVAASHVDGANLTLDVAPVNDSPRRLFEMVFARDMTFAGC